MGLSKYQSALTEIQGAIEQLPAAERVCQHLACSQYLETRTDLLREGSILLTKSYLNEWILRDEITVTEESLADRFCADL